MPRCFLFGVFIWSGYRDDQLFNDVQRPLWQNLKKVKFCFFAQKPLIIRCSFLVLQCSAILNCQPKWYTSWSNIISSVPSFKLTSWTTCKCPKSISIIQLRNLCSFSGMASSQSNSFQEAAKEAVSYLFKLCQGVARMWIDQIQGWLDGHVSEFSDCNSFDWFDNYLF